MDASIKRTILAAQEMERQRIARDLHDTTVQTMTGLVHKLELCSKLVDRDEVRCRLELKVMRNTLRDAISDLRDVIYNLRPMSLDDMGLDVTLERKLEHLSNKNNSATNIILNKKGNFENISSLKGITILHLVEEACNNAIKYAEADIITVDVISGPDCIDITISDDGCGFDINKVMRDKVDNMTSGFGLPIMKERVSALSGSFSIDSSIGKGTKIHISLPLEQGGNYD